MSGVRLDLELSLLVQSCKWNFASTGEQARPEIPAGVDWSRLVILARRHRVQGLAWNALAQSADRMPEAIRDSLASDARSIAATNLGIAAECRELLQTFQRAEVPLLFVKGLTLGALGYRSPLLKMGWDIDLLVDAGDLGAAAELLLRLGYALRLPTSAADLHEWHGRSKESVWHKDDSFHVELHTRLADNRRLIPTIDVHSPRQLVEVTPGVLIPTLAEEELIAYLAVHGASSAWFRLKWVSDFAALVDRRNREEIGQLYRRSQDLGGARASGQALLLADMLFGTLSQAPALRKELSSDWQTRLLCRAALRMMTKVTREPTEQPLGTLPIHWTQLFLKPGPAYKFSEVRRQCAGLLNRHSH